MTRRLAAIVFAAALLTGCGFHLRNALNLPENLGPVRVVAGDPYSALADNLAEALSEYTVSDRESKPIGRDVDEAVAIATELVAQIREMASGRQVLDYLC